ncbi:MAG: OmpA family protein [Flavobacteriales bacterium]|nr:MAG: OmpA family protein [Flavobacteriales bacterium TMED96]RZP10945.1 MAG: OmpA family protein [Flavobacteriales bacterium]|tara:strand:- start:2140 stop:4059 length:1920 start_codon:yes stop_codon:yes gene_type:complete
MKRKLVVFLVFNFYNFFVFSQLKDIQIDSLNYIWGDYYFLNSKYEKSISKYKLNEGNLSIDRFRNLAKSYTRTNNIEKAKSIYEKITKSNKATVLDYYNYANLLPAGSNLAMEYIEKAIKLPLEKVNRSDNVSNILPDEYIIENAQGNSKKGDHGLIFIDNKIDSKVFFLSEQSNSKEIKTRSKKVKSRFPIYNFYEGNFNSETFLIERTKNKLKNLNSQFQEGYGSYDQLNKTLYFTRSESRLDSNDSIQLNIYSTVLDKKNSIKLILKETNKYSNLHPSINSKSNRLYFSSNRPGGYGGMDIYYVDLLGDKFTEPTNLGPDINSEYNESFPYSYNDSIIFYSSDKADKGGKFDIYIAAKLVSNRWSTEALKENVNSRSDDFSFGINQKLKIGFLSSDRQDGMGEDDIYAFKFYPRLAGVEDFYEYKFSDTLIVAKNSVIFNDLELIHSVDPLQKLYKKTVILKSPPKSGNIVFNENGTFLYKSESDSISKDSFSYVLKSELKNSDPITVHLRRIKKQVNEVELEQFESIFFDFDKSDILSKYKERLDKLIKLLNKYPQVSLELSSYTDCRGSDSYNLGLSNRRNKSVVNYIKSRIKNPERVSGKGYGEKNSLSKNSCFKTSEIEHQKNRRTDFKLKL